MGSSIIWGWQGSRVTAVALGAASRRAVRFENLVAEVEHASRARPGRCSWLCWCGVRGSSRCMHGLGWRRSSVLQGEALPGIIVPDCLRTTAIFRC